jgi:hypothetical protein
VDKKNNYGVCEKCDFREVVFSTLDDNSIRDYATIRMSVIPEGEVINHEGENNCFKVP